MAEALPVFVARRRPEWQRLEALLVKLGTKRVTLSELTEVDTLSRHVATDLATAQRSFPGTDVHRFLNQLQVNASRVVHRRAAWSPSAIRHFYAVTFPTAVQTVLGPIRIAAAILIFGLVLGATAVWWIPDASQALVSPTLRSYIDQGQLWTDQALGPQTPGELATQIFLNNLRVMILSFVFGLTGGVLTVGVLLNNGLSFGAVVAACFRGGVGPQILTFTAAHGPIELSLMFIAGGAGLYLGQALIDPRERSRAVALREHGTVAVQVMIGAAPFVVLVGIVEGFVSPGPLFPWWIKLAAGGGACLGFWRWLLRPQRS